jgi:hypothetical protein
MRKCEVEKRGEFYVDLSTQLMAHGEYDVVIEHLNNYNFTHKYKIPVCFIEGTQVSKADWIRETRMDKLSRL